jgi:hypothetical protein
LPFKIFNLQRYSEDARVRRELEGVRSKVAVGLCRLNQVDP